MVVPIHIVYHLCGARPNYKSMQDGALSEHQNKLLCLSDTVFFEHTQKYRASMVYKGGHI